MKAQTTLLDLVTAVNEDADSEAEVIATVVHLVNSGTVRLCGNFRGARFDLGRLPRHPRLASPDLRPPRRGAPRATCGSSTWKRRPRGAFGAAQSRPSCASTIERLIERPETQAVALGGEEGLEEPLRDVRRHARIPCR